MNAIRRHVGLLTARDLEIRSWIWRVGGATLIQLQRRFVLGRTQAYRRLKVLIDYGLVRRRRLLADRPAVYVAPGRRLRPATFEHCLQVTELVVCRELAGARIVTELELRQARARSGQLLAFDGDDELSAALSCSRVPDAVELGADGALVAFELELSSKGRRLREAALAAYAASSYRRVIWIAPDPQLRALIQADVNELGLSELMEVSDEIPRN